MIDAKRALTTSILGSTITTVLFLGYLGFLRPQATLLSAIDTASSASAPTEMLTSDSIPDTVERTEPAVVSVVITKDVPVMEQYFDGQQSNPFNDPFFSPFSIHIPQYRQNGTQKKEVGGGTAFFVSTDGLLMTNKHVVDDTSAEYTVFLNDGKKLKANVVGTDPSNDIALLKVRGNGFPALRLSAKKARLGQTVIAIGNALAEFRNTVSVGVVSGLRRSITAGSMGSGGAEQLSGIIQTDAAVNQGNSGGPLLNLQGEVVGMNTAVAGGAQNIAFAIPSTDLQRVLSSYQKYGHIVRPYLGIRYQQVTEDVQTKNKLKENYGVIVSRGQTQDELAVLPGSPADKAGIVENDVILEADGTKLTDGSTLGSLIASRMPGEKVTLKIRHRGELKTVTVTLEEWKEHSE